MERAAAKTSRANSGQPVLAQSFKIGSLTIRYYSLTMVSALIVAYLIAWQRARRADWSEKFLEDLVFWMVVIGFIFARLYYVLEYWGQYYAQDLSEIYKIWHGGIGIYGGIAGGLLVIGFFAYRHKINFFSITDVLVPAVPIAQAIGRFGNFFNYEAFGKPTNLPWKMFVPEQFRPLGYQQDNYFHPTFAYEAIWDLFVFAALLALQKFCPKFAEKTGSITAIYLIGYSIGRFFIEFLRLDAVYLGKIPLATDQLIALILIAIGAIILFVGRSRPSNEVSSHS